MISKLKQIALKSQFRKALHNGYALGHFSEASQILKGLEVDMSLEVNLGNEFTQIFRKYDRKGMNSRQAFKFVQLGLEFPDLLQQARVAGLDIIKEDVNGHPVTHGKDGDVLIRDKITGFQRQIPYVYLPHLATQKPRIGFFDKEAAKSTVELGECEKCPERSGSGMLGLSLYGS